MALEDRIDALIKALTTHTEVVKENSELLKSAKPMLGLLKDGATVTPVPALADAPLPATDHDLIARMADAVLQPPPVKRRGRPTKEEQEAKRLAEAAQIAPEPEGVGEEDMSLAADDEPVPEWVTAPPVSHVEPETVPPAVVAEPPAPEVSFPMLRDLFLLQPDALTKIMDVAAVRALVKEHGHADKLAEVKPEHYAALYAAGLKAQRDATEV